MSSRRVWAETFPSLPRSRSSCRTCPSAGEAVQANAAPSRRMLPAGRGIGYSGSALRQNVRFLRPSEAAVCWHCNLPTSPP